MNRGTTSGHHANLPNPAGPTTHKKNEIPAINVSGTNVEEIVQTISQKLKITDFRIKNLNSYDKHIIQPGSTDNHKKIREMLKERKIDHSTFTLDENKNQTFRLKGIDGNYSAEEVYA